MKTTLLTMALFGMMAASFVGCGGGGGGSEGKFPMLPACRTSSDCSQGACEDCATGKCLITADASEKEEGRCWNLKQCENDLDCKTVGDQFGVDSWCWVEYGFGMCEPREAR